jgi:hypothetical protein
MFGRKNKIAQLEATIKELQSQVDSLMDATVIYDKAIGVLNRDNKALLREILSEGGLQKPFLQSKVIRYEV